MHLDVRLFSAIIIGISPPMSGLFNIRHDGLKNFKPRD